MRILVLAGENPELAAIENALRQSEIEIVASRSAPHSQEPSASGWSFAGWTLDSVTRDLVSPAGRHVDLTSSEYDLLTAFLREPGQALSRSTLMSAVRGRAWSYFDRSIDTLVARLRKKIDVDPTRRLIRSVRGIGYVFCASVSDPLAAPTSQAAESTQSSSLSRRAPAARADDSDGRAGRIRCSFPCFSR